MTLQGRGTAEKLAQPIPLVETVETETLEHCGDRKGQEGDGRSWTGSYEKMIISFLNEILDATNFGAPLPFGYYSHVLQATCIRGLWYRPYKTLFRLPSPLLLLHHAQVFGFRWDLGFILANSRIIVEGQNVSRKTFTSLSRLSNNIIWFVGESIISIIHRYVQSIQHYLSTIIVCAIDKWCSFAKVSETQ